MDELVRKLICISIYREVSLKKSIFILELLHITNEPSNKILSGLFIACHKSLRQYEFSDTSPTWIACRQNVNLTTTTTFVQN